MPQPGEFQVKTEGGIKVLRINYEGALETPSIEDNRNIMSRVFDILLEVGKVGKIVFLQREEYEYDWAQVRLLSDIVDVYKSLVLEENLLETAAHESPPSLGCVPRKARRDFGWQSGHGLDSTEDSICQEKTVFTVSYVFLQELTET